MSRTIRILGTHGVPANYGGFETAAQNVGRYLVEHGWKVYVYCQQPGWGRIHEDVWEGMHRVHIPVDLPGWRGTSLFDLLSIRHATKSRDLCLTFGYNTAVFNLGQRLRRVPNVINMDGIEWSRARWGWPRQAILYANERAACFVADHLIADHPEIERHLRTRARPAKISTLTYGADPVLDAPTDPVTRLGLTPGEYSTLVARPIPENSILEIVDTFSARRRDHRLVVVGGYSPDRDPYHAAVMRAASDEVVFAGPVYDVPRLQALRFHGRAYLHGHTVGGTNPSLVEALACENAVIAHDNAYNRWVADEAAVYFHDWDTLDDAIERVLGDDDLRRKLSFNARLRHEEEFTWEHVGAGYEQLLLRFVRGTRTPAGDAS